MKVCICGSRSITNYALLESVINGSGLTITEVISGGAKGVDTLAIAWAKANKIPWVEYPANWVQYGRRAGMLRNMYMVDTAEAVIVVWDGESPGSHHTFTYAMEKNKPVCLWNSLDNSMRLFGFSQTECSTNT